MKEGMLPKIHDYPNGNLLVTTEWLTRNLGSKDLAIIDARRGGYGESRIPGAVKLEYGDLMEGAGGVEQPAARLGRLGLHRDLNYVIYDEAGPDGGAGGVFWALEYLGCRNVHILDGGWDKWALERRPVSAEAIMAEAVGAGAFTAAPREAVRKSREQIAGRLGSADFALVDTRKNEAYNGWRAGGEKRGGHIPGAVNIRNEWFYGPDKTILPGENLRNILESHGITVEKEICAYGPDAKSSGFTYFILRLMGYSRCSNFDGGMVAWGADASLPLERLARYEKLVYPAWVKELLDGKHPPSYPGRGYVILEVRYNGFSTCQLGEVQPGGYIPGAISIDPGYVEHGEEASRYFPNYTRPSHAHVMAPERLESALADLGITRDTTVIIYGNGKIIPMTTARVAWALMYAGVEDVRIMNGGFPAWVEAGYPVASSPAVPAMAPDTGGSPLRPCCEYLATTDRIREVSERRREGEVLVDVRTIQEFRGEANFYPFFDKKGRIPNAVWAGDYFSFINPDDTFRCSDEVLKKWEEHGLTRERTPIFYCGTGWRSSVAFFLAFLMGYPESRNYDGGFFDWSWDADRCC